MTKKADPEKADAPPPFRWKLVLAQIAVVSLAVALIAGVGKAVYELWLKPPESGSRVASSTGMPAVGGPFAMVDQDGGPATEKVLLGKWTTVFFGYTFCPDVCPATLTSLGAAKQRMGPKGENLQTVFVSIDPERDTPAQLKTYLESAAFPKPIIGLTGSPEQVKATAKAYKVYYAKAQDAKPGATDYLMDHASAIYLMNPKGEFVKLIDPLLSPDDMAKAIASGMSGL